MNNIVRMLTVASAVAGLGLYAQDEEGFAADDASAGVAEAAEATQRKNVAYLTLPVCLSVEGRADVLVPGSKSWVAIEEGRHYPLGTMYRTGGADTKLRISFGGDVEVEIEGEASFGTRAQPLGEKTRTVVLDSGTIRVKLPRDLPDGVFFVTTPCFKALNMAGDSQYTYTKTGDGDETFVRCVSGTLNLEGSHYKILSMQAGNEIKIRNSSDQLFTGLYGSRGDYVARLDQGRFIVKDFETGEDRIDDRVLDWKLSPQTSVRIHRKRPALGEKLAVTVMTFDAAGQLKNRCAFAELTAEVNSGEIGPTSKKEREELAKKAREAQDAVTGAEGGSSEPADNAGASGGSSSGDEGGSDDSDEEF